MQVDDLEQALRDLADRQPAVSTTAYADILRRTRRHRLEMALGGAVAALVVVGASLLLVHRSPHPTRVATHPPSTAVAATGRPAPSPTPSAPQQSVPPTMPVGPKGEPVPDGFSAKSVTFVSTRTGWVLGTSHCAATACPPVLVRTRDGGTTWSSIPAPPTSFDQEAGISSVRFANLIDGWAFGPELWATHDGGATWHRVSVPGLPVSAPVMALETSGAVVHAAIAELDSGALRIATSVVAKDAWILSPTSVQLGAGPVPSPQIVLHGQAGWLVLVNRTVIGGARLESGRWVPWTPPCTDAYGSASLAASSPTDLVAVCNEGVWSQPPPPGVGLYVSTDSGTTFQRVATVPATEAGGVGSPRPRVAIAATAAPDGSGSGLIATFDGGAHWGFVFRGPGGTQVGFTTATNGVAIAASGEGSGALLTTHDGGHTWAATRFRSEGT